MATGTMGPSEVVTKRRYFGNVEKGSGALRFSLTAFLVGMGVFAVGMTLTSRLARPTIVRTGQPLDLAIVGDGYFMLQDWQTGEIAYTRYGAFEVGSDSTLKLRGTDYVLEHAIPVPFDGLAEVMVSPNGNVHGRCHEELDVTDYGCISICVFGRPSRLRRIGLSLYETTDESGVPVTDIPGQPGFGLVAAGWLEQPGLTDGKLLLWLAWSFIAIVLLLTLVQMTRVLRHMRRLADAAWQREARDDHNM